VTLGSGSQGGVGFNPTELAQMRQEARAEFEATQPSRHQMLMEIYERVETSCRRALLY